MKRIPKVDGAIILFSTYMFLRPCKQAISITVDQLNTNIDRNSSY